MPLDRAELRRAWIRGTVIAAASVLVGALLSGAWVASRYEAHLGRMAREAAELRERLGREPRGAGRDPAARAILELLEDPSTTVVSLHGTGAPAAHGRVLWSPTAGGYALARKLPPASDGKRYTLWALTPSGPRRVATLEVGPPGEASAHIAPAPVRVEGFSLTLEPGNPGSSPRGPTILTSR